jgi:quercetin dioxygenase-like cupin family protein
MEELATSLTLAPTHILMVTCAPGALTHRLQMFDGVVRIGREGEPAGEAHAGDSVQFAGGERHWHGATPGTLMTHLAVQATEPETLWEEHVSDESNGAAG